MKKKLEDIVQNITFISRKISLSFFVFFFLSFVISGVMLSLKLKWVWLEIIAKMLLVFSFLALAVSFTAPGFLIIFGYPKLAHVWLRGVNPIWPNKPWEQLSNGEKFIIYVNSIVPLVVILLGIVALIIQYVSG